ncbi:MAG TPA: DUF4296 domain-containing protein [Bacteroidia bacterium]|nr:DUF4296 domain-containing protein [Bacteroidia bacterium]
MISVKNIIAAAVSVLIFQSCSHTEKNIPKEIISPDSMVAIMVDVHLAEAAANVNRINDSQRFSAGELYPLIFKTHHIDSATFRKSFDYYLNHPDKFNRIYEQVIAELSKRESETNVK